MQPSPLTAHLGYWLRAVSNHVSQSFAARLQAEGVSVADWVALRLLYDAELPPSRLAAAMGVTRGAVSKLSDRLERRGLTTRRAEGQDGRAAVLALTDAGRRMVPRLAELADLNDAASFGHLSPDQRTALTLLLQDLIRRHGLTAPPLT